MVLSLSLFSGWWMGRVFARYGLSTVDLSPRLTRSFTRLRGQISSNHSRLVSLEPPLKDKYGFVHISTGLLAKVMDIFG